MPAKSKAVAKAKETKESEAATPPPAPARTIHERSQRRFANSHPFERARQEVGLSGLSPADQTSWVCARSLSAASVKKLANRAQRDLWRNVNDASLPVRAARKPPAVHDWGRDRSGREVGEYTPEEFDRRIANQIALTALEVASRAFIESRQRAARKAVDPRTGEVCIVTETEVEEEKTRRSEMAALRAELYGQRTGKYAADPEWDDVVPIPQADPEGALAAIAYPEDYAEATSYLRAVMANKEFSPRCLRLTEHVISLNPAHYTVWLYRLSVITALNLPIPDEIAWVNGVALENLKNYQIWHHRQLLMEKHYPAIAASPERVAALAESETAFLTRILAEDTKNYHVWSYRQYLVRRLGLWGGAELAATEAMIADDVRNNSAWSHRFYLVFSDPSHSTPGVHSTVHDSAVPAAVIDGEIRYAQDKILLAPQNQSPWNYLKGVLAKAGRKASSVEGFAAQFVRNLGSKEGEDVKSSHALDMLAEVYAEKGDRERADLCLKRLAEKWDRVRAGYWEWRRKALPK